MFVLQSKLRQVHRIKREVLELNRYVRALLDSRGILTWCRCPAAEYCGQCHRAVIEISKNSSPTGFHAMLWRGTTRPWFGGGAHDQILVHTFAEGHKSNTPHEPRSHAPPHARARFLTW